MSQNLNCIRMFLRNGCNLRTCRHVIVRIMLASGDPFLVHLEPGTLCLWDLKRRVHSDGHQCKRCDILPAAHDSRAIRSHHHFLRSFTHCVNSGTLRPSCKALRTALFTRGALNRSPAALKHIGSSLSLSLSPSLSLSRSVSLYRHVHEHISYLCVRCGNPPGTSPHTPARSACPPDEEEVEQAES